MRLLARIGVVLLDMVSECLFFAEDKIWVALVFTINLSVRLK